MGFNGIITQSVSTYPLIFFMRATANEQGATGLSPTVTISKNGGSFASPAGAVTEVGAGYYKVAGNATDVGTAGPLRLTATGAGAYQVDESWQINPLAGLSCTTEDIADDLINQDHIGANAFTASAFAADVFTAFANAVVATGLPLISDTQQHGTHTIVKGNSYGSTSRSFLITIADGADWPTDLSLWTWAFAADKHADNSNTGDASTTGTVAVVQATGASRSVRVTLTSTATSTMAVGQYRHSLRGTQTGGLVWTIELGTLEVIDDPGA